MDTPSLQKELGVMRILALAYACYTALNLKFSQPVIKVARMEGLAAVSVLVLLGSLEATVGTKVLYLMTSSSVDRTIKLYCTDCSSVTDNCKECSGTPLMCTVCEDGYTLNEKTGICGNLTHAVQNLKRLFCW